MKPIAFHPEASQEYTEAIEYYAAVSLELGQRLGSELQHLANEVSRDPQRFWRFHPPAQRALSRHFPYALVYLDQPDRVWIVAVMHTKRRPGYWKLEKSPRLKVVGGSLRASVSPLCAAVSVVN